MKRNLLTGLFLLLSVGLAAAGYLLLPDAVATQISFSGKISSTMPKLPAVLIPCCICLLGSLMWRFGEDKSRVRFLLLTLLGYLIFVFMFVINL